MPKQGGIGETPSLMKPSEATSQRLPDPSMATPSVSSSALGSAPHVYCPRVGGLIVAPEVENSRKKPVWVGKPVASQMSSFASMARPAGVPPPGVSPELDVI